MARPVRVRLLGLTPVRRAAVLRLAAALAGGAGALAVSLPAGAAEVARAARAGQHAEAAGSPARAAAPHAGTLPPVDVIAPAPLPGLSVPRSAVPVGVQSTGREPFDRARPATIGDVLAASFTGVHLASSQSNPYQPDLSFRGMTVSPLLGSQNALVVLVDGVRVNESFGDVVLWDLIPNGAVAGVDLVPGGGPVFGPNALGGTLQVRTRTGRDLQGTTVDAATGSFGRRGVEAAAGGTRDAFDGFVVAGAHDEDGWRDRSPSRLRQLHAKGGWQDERVRIALAYTHADNALTGNGLAPEPLLASRREAVYTYPDESRPELDFWTGEATRWLGNGVSIAARAYVRELQLDTLNGDAEYDDGDTPGAPADDAYEAELRSSTTRQRTTGAAAQLAWEGRENGRTHRAALGLTHDRGRATYTQFEQAATFTPDGGVVADGAFERDTDVASRTSYTGVYVTDTITFAERLHVTPAARHDRATVELADRSGTQPALNGRHSFHRLSPSLGLAWAATPEATLTLSYAEGFRVPTPVELTCASPDDPCALPVAFVADPPLDPVVSRTWEAGARGRWRGVEARTAVFHTSLRNDILFTGLGASRGFFANVPETRRHGAELALAGRAARLDWRLSYAFVDATYRSALELFNPVATPADPTVPATITVRPGDRLPATPRHLARLGLEWRPRAASSLGATLAYTSSQYLRGDDANGAPPLEGHAVLGLRAEHRFTARLSVELALDNVLDEGYATVGVLNRTAFDAAKQPLEGGPGPVQRFVSPAAPRSFWLTVRYRWQARTVPDAG